MKVSSNKRVPGGGSIQPGYRELCSVERAAVASWKGVFSSHSVAQFVLLRFLSVSLRFSARHKLLQRKGSARAGKQATNQPWWSRERLRWMCRRWCQPVDWRLISRHWANWCGVSHFTPPWHLTALISVSPRSFAGLPSSPLCKLWQYSVSPCSAGYSGLLLYRWFGFGGRLVLGNYVELDMDVSDSGGFSRSSAVVRCVQECICIGMFLDLPNGSSSSGLLDLWMFVWTWCFCCVFSLLCLSESSIVHGPCWNNWGWQEAASLPISSTCSFFQEM